MHKEYKIFRIKGEEKMMLIDVVFLILTVVAIFGLSYLLIELIEKLCVRKYKEKKKWKKKVMKKKNKKN